MVAIVFTANSSPGINTAESGGRLLNCYAEDLGDGAPAPYVIKRSPGLFLLSDTGQTVFRGCFFEPSGNYVYSGWSGLLRKTDNLTVTTAVGALPGTDFLTFARNNKSPTPDFVAVRSTGGAYTFTAASVTAYADPDLPVTVNSVTYGESFFFYTCPDGRCFASGINAVTQNANDFITAEAKPDGLKRGIFFNSELYLWGSTNCEVWGSQGDPNPTGFPLRRTTVLWSGLASVAAISGWEDGFSPTLIWVADDFTVRQLNGYTPVKISPPELDRLLAATSGVREIWTAAYVVGGHACVAVSDGSTFTWVYDITTGKWHERQSGTTSYWRLKGNTTYAFGAWRGGDWNTGELHTISEARYTENLLPLTFQAESIQLQGFPDRILVPRADFKFSNVSTGNGNFSYSDDGGSTWSTPQTRSLASQITLLRQGLSGPKGRRWRVTVSDNVYVGLLGGDMHVGARAG